MLKLRTNIEVTNQTKPLKLNSKFSILHYSEYSIEVFFR
jgi:hypothetical protein